MKKKYPDKMTPAEVKEYLRGKSDDFNIGYANYHKSRVVSPPFGEGWTSHAIGEWSRGYCYAKRMQNG